MANNELNLLPCAHCGGANLSTDAYSVQPDDFHSAYIECDYCEARGPNALTVDGWLSSKEEAASEAAKAWNRRTAPAQAEPSGALPELPPLPEDPAGVCDVITSQIIGPNGVTGDVIECTDGYSADQVRAYATAYAKQAIEARILGQQGAGDAAKPDPIEQARIDGWAEGMTEAQELLADEIADTARLDFVLKRQAFICLIPGEKADSYQLMEQDEDEDYQVISGEGIMYRTTREAVDAAIAAIQDQAGDAPTGGA